MNTPDPRDPLGLAAAAPLLAAWLNWTELARAGRLAPMTTPGHKHREDLVGAVAAGDVPLYGGLDTIKRAGPVRIAAEALAALREVAAYGGRIAYAEDPTLDTFQVVAG